MGKRGEGPGGGEALSGVHGRLQEHITIIMPMHLQGSLYSSIPEEQSPSRVIQPKMRTTCTSRTSKSV